MARGSAPQGDHAPEQVATALVETKPGKPCDHAPEQVAKHQAAGDVTYESAYPKGNPFWLAAGAFLFSKLYID